MDEPRSDGPEGKERDEEADVPAFDYSTAQLSFEGLDPTEFEELCFELLQVVGRTPT